MIGERTEERRWFTQDEKKQILKRSYGVCACCGKKLNLKAMTIEHIIPLLRGGTNDMENLIALCYDCNQMKDNMLYLPHGFYNALRDKPVFDEMEEHVRKWFRTIKDEFDFERYPLIAPKYSFQVTMGSGGHKGVKNKRQAFIRQLILEWNLVGDDLYAEVEAVTGISIQEVRKDLCKFCGVKEHPIALYVLKKPSDDKLLAVVAVSYEKDFNRIAVSLPWYTMPKAYIANTMLKFVAQTIISLESIVETHIYTYAVLAKSYDAVAEFDRDENAYLGLYRQYIPPHYDEVAEKYGVTGYHMIEITRPTKEEMEEDKIIEKAREDIRKSMKTRRMMAAWYYEVGVNPTGDIEDGYSLYVKVPELLPSSEDKKLEYLVKNNYISASDARDAMYVKDSTKEDYEWAMAGKNK